LKGSKFTCLISDSGDIRLDESGFGFARVNVYTISYHVHLHNYTIVYTNMVAVTKFVAKNNKTTTSGSKTMCHFGDLMHSSFVYKNYEHNQTTLQVRR